MFYCCCCCCSAYARPCATPRSIQFVKTDNCHKPDNYSEQELYGNFSAALNATGAVCSLLLVLVVL